MRLKLFLLLAFFATLPMLAQQAGVRGVVIDAKSGLPVAGATVMLDNQGNAATTGSDGAFVIDDAFAGSDQLLVLAYGYKDWETAVTIVGGMVENLGSIRVEPLSFESAQALEYRNSVAELALTESQLEDEEGNTQEVALLSGATDNPFYQAASYCNYTYRLSVYQHINQASVIQLVLQVFALSLGGMLFNKLRRAERTMRFLPCSGMNGCRFYDI